MAAEPSSARFRLEATIVFVAWTVFALLLTHQSYIQALLSGREVF